MARVKICGITNLKDAKLAVSLGAHALGFIFYKKSPRSVTPTQAKEIIEHLPPFVSVVGVFVNENEDVVGRIAASCSLHALQFHGDESPSYCRRFKRYKVIKAFRVNTKADIQKISRYDVDAFLFDTFKEGEYGGTGKVFDWNVIKKRNFSCPVILSGGLNSKNVKKAIRTLNPYAVDVSSGVETAPGKKSEKLLKELFKNV